MYIYYYALATSVLDRSTKQMRQYTTSLENFVKSPASLAVAFAVGAALFPPLGVSSRPP
jgi:hypothetical protein